ncbi:hypothetical protein ANTPLA_LOCUS8957 [Anthophora plagiata]
MNYSATPSYRSRSQRSRSGRSRTDRSRERRKPHESGRRDREARERRSRSRTRYSLNPPSTNRCSSERSRARSRDSDIARLAEVLAGIANSTTRKSSHNFLNEKFLPEFDPAAENLSASEWIAKINDCGVVYEWDDKVKLYLSGCKLRGNAKRWYDGLTHSLLNWEVFSHALITQFPGEGSFGRLFNDAAAYKSKPGQDLQEYCFNKLGKINKLKLDIPEHQVVDLIAHDIHDEAIRTAVLTAKLGTVAKLNQMLSIFTASGKSKENKEGKETKDPNSSRDSKQAISKQASARGPINRDSKALQLCHACKKPGHFKRDCPERAERGVQGSDVNKSVKAAVRCTYCNNIGHGEEKCFKKRDDQAAGKRK